MLRKYETVTVFKYFNIKRHQGKYVYSICKGTYLSLFFFIF